MAPRRRPAVKSTGPRILGLVTTGQLKVHSRACIVPLKIRRSDPTECFSWPVLAFSRRNGPLEVEIVIWHTIFWNFVRWQNLTDFRVTFTRWKSLWIEKLASAASNVSYKSICHSDTQSVLKFRDLFKFSCVYRTFLRLFATIKLIQLKVCENNIEATILTSIYISIFFFFAYHPLYASLT